MPKQLLIYDDPAPLSAETHRDISVRMPASYGFASGLNSVPVVVAEFERLSAEAPIVFAGEGDAMMPAVVLGLAEGQNLFLDPQGGWTGRYVPAFLRRYPFVFASVPDDADKLTLCLDMAHEGVNKDGRGERLFDSESNRTQFLQGILDFNSDYQAQFMTTRAFVQELQALDLFEQATATATLPDGRNLSLSGFTRINIARLRALPDDKVLELFRSQRMELIYLHLASLGQTQALLERINALPEQDAA